MYDMFIKKLIMPAYFSITDNIVLQRLLELDRSQYLSLDHIQNIQFTNLKKLLLHCYTNVPFYRARFDCAGFDPFRFSGIDDLKCIPYLTKRDIQAHKNNLIATNLKADLLVADASGGSTGQPTNFYKDSLRNQLRSADKMRHDMWCGWEPGDKYATLWGAQREFDIQPAWKTRIVEKYIYRTFGFNAFDLSESKVLTYVENLKNIKPVMVVAYANVAYLFSRIIQSHNLDLGGLRLKGLISSAETLTDEKRASIESAFRTKVLNRYGSREVGLIASECLTQEGLHVNAENVLVEIQKGGRDAHVGEMGEIIVTDLWNYGMPFIRYQMGDVGISCDRQCSCGRGLPLLGNVTGRVSDFIVDANGGLVHGEYFSHLFYGIEGIKQFQLIQESKDEIKLNIYPNNKFEFEILEPIICKIKLCVGLNVYVNVQVIDESLIEMSGKFRFTISKIANHFFDGCNDALKAPANL